MHFLHRNIESHEGRNGLKIILTEEEVLLGIVEYYADFVYIKNKSRTIKANIIINVVVPQHNHY
jgi:hypothetical protein